MAARRITIDADVYDRLLHVKRKGESLSDTLRRVVWDPVPFRAVLRELEADPLSEDAISAIEQVVAARNPSPVRPEPER